MVLPLVSYWWWSCCFCLAEDTTTNHRRRRRRRRRRQWRQRWWRDGDDDEDVRRQRLQDDVTKIRYFGTYIRYLPTNPTSHHCDNIPANPSWITDIFRYHLMISTSSSTVELVYSVRIFFETPLITFRLSVDNNLINFYFTESLRPKT